MKKPLQFSGSAKARTFATAMIVVLSALVTVLPGSAAAADLSNNTNVGGVMNNPNPNCSPGLMVAPGFEAHVNELVTYHWNNGHGARPGTLSLRSMNGQTYGPFNATGSSGQGGAPNVNWTANVNLILPAGTYVLNDSDHATWSQNAQSHNCGFTIIRGTLVSKLAPVANNPLMPGNSLPGPGSVPPGFKPCFVNTGSVASVSPCFGPANNPITVMLSRAVTWRPDKLVFRKVIQNGVPAQIISQLSGSGMIWTTPTPIQLCAHPAGTPAMGQWEVILIDNRGGNQGSIGGFTITGCP
jgi:hypothetical protein